MIGKVQVIIDGEKSEMETYSVAQLDAEVKKVQDKLGKLVIKDIHGLENTLKYKSGTDHNHDHRYPLMADFNLLKKEVGNNTKKNITNATITGDVNKTLTLTFADGSILQTSFVDNQGGGSPQADIMLNSLNFDPQTGVLKGVRSDGQVLTVNLDGRYAPKEKDRLILMQRINSNEIEVIREPSELPSMNMSQLDISKLPIFENLRTKPQPLVAKSEAGEPALVIEPSYSMNAFLEGAILNEYGRLHMISNGQKKELVFKEDVERIVEEKIQQMQNIIGG